MPELLERDVLELETELLGDHLPARERCDVLEHRFAPVAEAGGFDCSVLQHAANLIHDQRRERFALDVFRDEQDRAPGFRDLLQQRNDVLQHAELAIADQNVRVLQHRLHRARVR